jgi:hypothetical protein
MNTTTTASIIRSLAIASIALAGCGGATTGPTTPASGASPLDGTAYEVTLAFPGEAPVKDTLRFQAGHFESTACTAVGFPEWSDYRAQIDAGAIAFAVLARNPDGTTMDWKGTVSGDAVEGTATRTLAGQASTASVHGTRR